MKYIKLFEELNIPRVGDYVLLEIEFSNSIELQNFINNNIGKIIRRNVNHENLDIQYVDIPENIKYCFSTKNSRVFHIHNIIIFGTKEQMELELQVKKYNL